MDAAEIVHQARAHLSTVIVIDLLHVTRRCMCYVLHGSKNAPSHPNLSRTVREDEDRMMLPYVDSFMLLFHQA